MKLGWFRRSERRHSDKLIRIQTLPFVFRLNFPYGLLRRNLVIASISRSSKAMVLTRAGSPATSAAMKSPGAETLWSGSRNKCISLPASSLASELAAPWPKWIRIPCGATWKSSTGPTSSWRPPYTRGRKVNTNGEDGLVEGHAYSIIHAVERKGFKLVCCRTFVCWA